MEDKLQIEILNALGNKPELLFPHTIGQRLDREYKPFDYIVAISRKIVELLILGFARILIALFPRAGKTRQLICTIIWRLIICPSEQIIFSSHSEDFAKEIVRIIRNLILEHQELLGIRLSPDSQSAESFKTVQGGGVIAVGIGSGLLGRAANLLILDDIYPSWEKSQNPKEQRKVEEWFCGTAYTRLEPRASIIVCQARFHIKDLSGFLINQHSDDWTVLGYPAISPEGKALCPERFDINALEKIRASIGEAKFQAQYQQEPLPEIQTGDEVVFDENSISKIGISHLPALAKMPPNTKWAVRYLAFDPGKRKSHSAVVVGELVEIEDSFELHILYLKQYPLGYRVSKIIEELDEFSLDPRFGELAPIILLDKTGPQGDIVLELMQKRRMSPIIGITVLSSGKGRSKFTGLKSDLVEDLQTLIEEDRLRHAESLQQVDVLFDELKSYRRYASPKGRSICYRPHSLKTDDFVDCLALIAFAAEKGLRPLFVRESVGLYGNTRRRPLSGNRGDISENLRRSAYAEAHPDYAQMRGWI